MTSQATAYFTPWTLDFEQDGTEDIAIIRDAEGDDIVRSRPFWLPDADAPIPPTLAAIRLMAAAPRLLTALIECATLLADHDEGQGEEGDAYREALAAIAEATG
jgi:hypothetical protein